MTDYEVTDYLKGIAIMTVWSNHFVNRYVSSDFMGYAYGVIALFFILSGYGIFLSLDNNRSWPFFILEKNFFIKRALRIYPLLLIWYVISGFPETITSFFAFDFIAPERHWFVRAIIQCYLVAVPLFLLVKRVPFVYHFLIVVVLFGIINYILLTNGYSPEKAVGYKGYFLFHVILFYSGYILAETKRHNFSNTYLLISFLVFIFLVNEQTRHALTYFQGKRYIYPIIFGSAAFSLCYMSLNVRCDFIYKKIIIFIGSCSYSIYLFHGSSFNVLRKMEIIHQNDTDITGIVIWIITIPLFVFAFAALEIFINEMVLGKQSVTRAIRTYINALPFQLKAAREKFSCIKE